MTIDKEKLGKYKEIFLKILDDAITKEEAISEYMKLGDSYKDAEGAYREIKSDMYKAEHGLL